LARIAADQNLREFDGAQFLVDKTALPQRKKMPSHR
jgi:hypothetical protein